MYFALPLLIALTLWLLAILSGVREVPAVAVWIGCIIAYLIVFLGRRFDFLPGREVHVGFIPVLVALGTALVIPAIRLLPTWINKPKGSVAITYELDIGSKQPSKTPYEILKKTVTDNAQTFQEKAVALGQSADGQPGQADVGVQPHTPGGSLPTLPRNPSNNEDDIAEIQNMHSQVKQAADMKAQGFKMPSPEEMKKLREEADKLLNQ